jgi:hypothetical protein
VPARVLVEREPELRCHEIVWSQQRADLDLGPQRARRGERENAVDPAIGECQQVRAVIDRVRRPVVVESVPLKHEVIACVDEPDIATSRGNVDPPAFPREAGAKQGGPDRECQSQSARSIPG